MICFNPIPIKGKGSRKYAWIMDKLREERQRGVTITWKMWNLTGKEHEIDCIDCPGHSNFVKNMAVGSSCADSVVVVISAAPGEFEMGFLSVAKNTQREILICKTQGIENFIFAINKFDLFEDSAKAKERFEEIRLEVLHTVKKKFAISEEQCCFIPMSAWTGSNLLEHDDEGCAWWQGGTFRGKPVRSVMDAMDTESTVVREASAPLLLPVVCLFAFFLFLFFFFFFSSNLCTTSRASERCWRVAC